jgi:hypothetical protein
MHSAMGLHASADRSKAAEVARDKARVQLIKTHFGTRIASELGLRSEERSVEQGSGRFKKLRREVVDHVVERLRSTAAGELQGGQEFTEYWELIERDGLAVHRVHVMLQVSRSALDQQVQRWLGKQPHVVKARALRREVARMVEEQRHHAKAGLEAVAVRDLARLAPHQHRVRKLRGKLESAAQRYQRAMGDVIDVGALESPEVAELEAEVVALAATLTLEMSAKAAPSLGNERAAQGAANGLIATLGLQTRQSMGGVCESGADFHLHMGLGSGSCVRQAMGGTCCKLDVQWRLTRCGDGELLASTRADGNGCVSTGWAESAARGRALELMTSGENRDLSGDLSEFLSPHLPIAVHQEAP